MRKVVGALYYRRGESAANGAAVPDESMAASLNFSRHAEFGFTY
jgi:hypothetical protein